MRKIIYAFLAGLMAVTLCSCGNTTNTSDETKFNLQHLNGPTDFYGLHWEMSPSVADMLIDDEHIYNKEGKTAYIVTAYKDPNAEINFGSTSMLGMWALTFHLSFENGKLKSAAFNLTDAYDFEYVVHQISKVYGEPKYMPEESDPRAAWVGERTTIVAAGTTGFSTENIAEHTTLIYFQPTTDFNENSRDSFERR